MVGSVGVSVSAHVRLCTRRGGTADVSAEMIPTKVAQGLELLGCSHISGRLAPRNKILARGWDIEEARDTFSSVASAEQSLNPAFLTPHLRFCQIARQG